MIVFCMLFHNTEWRKEPQERQYMHISLPAFNYIPEDAMTGHCLSFTHLNNGTIPRHFKWRHMLGR